MRFLCLHGQGNNSEIMELQTRTLRGLLPQTFDYEFVDGEEDADPVEGMELIYPGPYLQYASCAESVPASIKYLEEIIEEEGPFDGVLGFSQGAAVAARLILRHLQRDPFGPQPFKMAVFLSAAALFYHDSRQEYEELMEPLSKLPVDLPTVHVVGSKDPYRPFSLDIIKLCDKRTSRVIDADMGHEIPRDGKVLEATRNGIEWAARLCNIGR